MNKVKNNFSFVCVCKKKKTYFHYETHSNLQIIMVSLDFFIALLVVTASTSCLAHSQVRTELYKKLKNVRMTGSSLRAVNTTSVLKCASVYSQNNYCASAQFGSGRELFDEVHFALWMAVGESKSAINLLHFYILDLSAKKLKCIFCNLRCFQNFMFVELKILIIRFCPIVLKK